MSELLRIIEASRTWEPGQELGTETIPEDADVNRDNQGDDERRAALARMKTFSLGSRNAVGANPLQRISSGSGFGERLNSPTAEQQQQQGERRTAPVAMTVPHDVPGQKPYYVMLYEQREAVHAANRDEMTEVVARFATVCANLYAHFPNDRQGVFSLNAHLQQLMERPLSERCEVKFWEDRAKLWQQFQKIVVPMCNDAFLRCNSMMQAVDRDYDWRPRVYNLLQAYSPEKLNHIADIMAKIKDSEEMFIAAMVHKYGPEPEMTNEILSTQSTDAAYSTNRTLRDRLLCLMKEYTPAQVGKIDELMAKYKGREQKLIDAYVDKYGPEPPPPPPPPPPEHSMTQLEGTASFTNPRGIFVHVWTSNQEARRFITAASRMWQYLFESRCDGLVCPFSALCTIQGCYVTATACVPLLSKHALDLAKLPMCAEQLHSAAVHLHVDFSSVESCVYNGGDGRRYVLMSPMWVPTFVVHDDDCGGHGPRLSCSSEVSDIIRLELLVALEKYDGSDCNPETAVSRATPAAAFRLLEEVTKHVREAAKGKIPTAQTVSAALDVMLRASTMASVLHDAGLSVHHLYRVLKEIEGDVSIGHDAKAITLKLLYHELAQRTVKELVRSELWYPGHDGAAEPKQAAINKYRADLVNRAMAVLVLKPVIWETQTLPVMRRKFRCPPDFAFEHTQLIPKLVVSAVAARLGCDYDAQTKRFTGLNSAALVPTSFQANHVSRLVLRGLRHEAATLLQKQFDEACAREGNSLQALRRKFHDLRRVLVAAGGHLLGATPGLVNLFPGALEACARVPGSETIRVHASSFAIEPLLVFGDKTETKASLRQCVDAYAGLLEEHVSYTSDDVFLLYQYRLMIQSMLLLKDKPQQPPMYLSFVKEMLLMERRDPAMAGSQFFELMCVGAAHISTLPRLEFDDLIEPYAMWLISSAKVLPQRQERVAEALLRLCGLAMNAKHLEGSSKMKMLCTMLVNICASLYGQQDDRTTMALMYMSFFVVSARAAQLPQAHLELVQEYQQACFRLHFADERERRKTFKADWHINRMLKICDVLKEIGEWATAELILFHNAEVALRLKKRSELEKVAAAVLAMTKASSAIQRLQELVRERAIRRGPKKVVFNEYYHRLGIAYLEWEQRREVPRLRFIALRERLKIRAAVAVAETWDCWLREMSDRCQVLLEEDLASRVHQTQDAAALAKHLCLQEAIRWWREVHLDALEGYHRLSAEEHEQLDRRLLRAELEQYENANYEQLCRNRLQLLFQEELAEFEVLSRAHLVQSQFFPLQRRLLTDLAIRFDRQHVAGEEAAARLENLIEPSSRQEVHRRLLHETCVLLQRQQDDRRRALWGTEGHAYAKILASDNSAHAMRRARGYLEEEEERMRSAITRWAGERILAVCEDAEAARRLQLIRRTHVAHMEVDEGLARIWLIAEEGGEAEQLRGFGDVTEGTVRLRRAERHEFLSRSVLFLDLVVTFRVVLVRREEAERTMVVRDCHRLQVMWLMRLEAHNRQALVEVLDVVAPFTAFLNVQGSIQRRIIVEAYATEKLRFTEQLEALHRFALFRNCVNSQRRLVHQGREMLRRCELYHERITDMLLLAYLAEKSARRRLEKVEVYLRKLLINAVETLHRKFIEAQHRARTPVLLVVMRRQMEASLMARRCGELLPIIERDECFRRNLLVAEEGSALLTSIASEEASQRALTVDQEDGERQQLIHWVVAEVRREVLFAQFSEWLFLRDLSVVQMLEIAGRGMLAQHEGTSFAQLEHLHLVRRGMQMHVQERRSLKAKRKTTAEILAARLARRDVHRQQHRQTGRQRRGGRSPTSMSTAKVGSCGELVDAEEMLRGRHLRAEETRRRDVMEIERAMRSSLCLKIGIPLSQSTRGNHRRDEQLSGGGGPRGRSRRAHAAQGEVGARLQSVASLGDVERAEGVQRAVLLAAALRAWRSLEISMQSHYLARAYVEHEKMIGRTSASHFFFANTSSAQPPCPQRIAARPSAGPSSTAAHTASSGLSLLVEACNSDRKKHVSALLLIRDLSTGVTPQDAQHQRILQDIHQRIALFCSGTQPTSEFVKDGAGLRASKPVFLALQSIHSHLVMLRSSTHQDVVSGGSGSSSEIGSLAQQLWGAAVWPACRAVIPGESALQLIANKPQSGEASALRFIAHHRHSSSSSSSSGGGFSRAALAKQMRALSRHVQLVDAIGVVAAGVDSPQVVVDVGPLQHERRLAREERAAHEERRRRFLAAAENRFSQENKLWNLEVKEMDVRRRLFQRGLASLMHLREQSRIAPLDAVASVLVGANRTAGQPRNVDWEHARHGSTADRTSWLAQNAIAHLVSPPAAFALSPQAGSTGGVTHVGCLVANVERARRAERRRDMLLRQHWRQVFHNSLLSAESQRSAPTRVALGSTSTVSGLDDPTAVAIEAAAKDVAFRYRRLQRELNENTHELSSDHGPGRVEADVFSSVVEAVLCALNSSSDDGVRDVGIAHSTAQGRSELLVRERQHRQTILALAQRWRASVHLAAANSMMRASRRVTQQRLARAQAEVERIDPTVRLWRLATEMTHSESQRRVAISRMEAAALRLGCLLWWEKLLRHGVVSWFLHAHLKVVNTARIISRFTSTSQIASVASAAGEGDTSCSPQSAPRFHLGSAATPGDVEDALQVVESAALESLEFLADIIMLQQQQVLFSGVRKLFQDQVVEVYVTDGAGGSRTRLRLDNGVSPGAVDETIAQLATMGENVLDDAMERCLSHFSARCDTALWRLQHMSQLQAQVRELLIYDADAAADNDAGDEFTTADTVFGDGVVMPSPKSILWGSPHACRFLGAGDVLQPCLRTLPLLISEVARRIAGSGPTTAAGEKGDGAVASFADIAAVLPPLVSATEVTGNKSPRDSACALLESHETGHRAIITAAAAQALRDTAERAALLAMELGELAARRSVWAEAANFFMEQLHAPTMALDFIHDMNRAAVAKPVDVPAAAAMTTEPAASAAARATAAGAAGNQLPLFLSDKAVSLLSLPWGSPGGVDSDSSSLCRSWDPLELLVAVQSAELVISERDVRAALEQRLLAELRELFMRQSTLVEVNHYVVPIKFDSDGNVDNSHFFEHQDAARQALFRGWLARFTDLHAQHQLLAETIFRRWPLLLNGEGGHREEDVSSRSIWGHARRAWAAPKVAEKDMRSARSSSSPPHSAKSSNSEEGVSARVETASDRPTVDLLAQCVADEEQERHRLSRLALVYAADRTARLTDLRALEAARRDAQELANRKEPLRYLQALERADRVEITADACCSIFVLFERIDAEMGRCPARPGSAELLTEAEALLQLQHEERLARCWLWLLGASDAYYSRVKQREVAAKASRSGDSTPGLHGAVPSRNVLVARYIERIRAVLHQRHSAAMAVQRSRWATGLLSLHFTAARAVIEEEAAARLAILGCHVGELLAVAFPAEAEEAALSQSTIAEDAVDKQQLANDALRFLGDREAEHRALINRVAIDAFASRIAQPAIAAATSVVRGSIPDIECPFAVEAREALHRGHIERQEARMFADGIKHAFDVEGVVRAAGYAANRIRQLDFFCVRVRYRVILRHKLGQCVEEEARDRIRVMQEESAAAGGSPENNEDAAQPPPPPPTTTLLDAYHAVLDRRRRELLYIDELLGIVHSLTALQDREERDRRAVEQECFDINYLVMEMQFDNLQRALAHEARLRRLGHRPPSLPPLSASEHLTAFLTSVPGSSAAADPTNGVGSVDEFLFVDYAALHRCALQEELARRAIEHHWTCDLRDRGITELARALAESVARSCAAAQKAIQGHRERTTERHLVTAVETEQQRLIDAEVCAVDRDAAAAQLASVAPPPLRTARGLASMKATTLVEELLFLTYGPASLVARETKARRRLLEEFEMCAGVIFRLVADVLSQADVCDHRAVQRAAATAKRFAPKGPLTGIRLPSLRVLDDRERFFRSQLAAAAMERAQDILARERHHRLLKLQSCPPLPPSSQQQPRQHGQRGRAHRGTFASRRGNTAFPAQAAPPFKGPQRHQQDESVSNPTASAASAAALEIAAFEAQERDRREALLVEFRVSSAALSSMHTTLIAVDGSTLGYESVDPLHAVAITEALRRHEMLKTWKEELDLLLLHGFEISGLRDGELTHAAKGHDAQPQAGASALLSTQPKPTSKEQEYAAWRISHLEGIEHAGRNRIESEYVDVHLALLKRERVMRGVVRSRAGAGAGAISDADAGHPLALEVPLGRTDFRARVPRAVASVQHEEFAARRDLGSQLIDLLMLLYTLKTSMSHTTQMRIISRVARALDETPVGTASPAKAINGTSRGSAAVAAAPAPQRLPVVRLDAAGSKAAFRGAPLRTLSIKKRRSSTALIDACGGATKEAVLLAEEHARNAIEDDAEAARRALQLREQTFRAGLRAAKMPAFRISRRTLPMGAWGSAQLSGPASMRTGMRSLLPRPHMASSPVLSGVLPPTRQIAALASGAARRSKGTAATPPPASRPGHLLPIERDAE